MSAETRSAVAYTLAYLATRQWNRLGLGATPEDRFELDDDVALLDAPRDELLAAVDRLAASDATRARAEALLHAAPYPVEPPPWAAARWDEVDRAVREKLGPSTVEFLEQTGLWRPAT